MTSRTALFLGVSVLLATALAAVKLEHSNRVHIDPTQGWLGPEPEVRTHAPQYACSSTGGTLYWPPGTYTVSSTIITSPCIVVTP